MSDSVRLFRNVPLKSRNTFGVPAFAPLLAEVDDASVLPDVLASANFRDHPPLVIGGGSNLLFVGDPQVPLLALTGNRVTVVAEVHDAAILRADAGTTWHALVMESLALGLCGLENLALIPGTVGAAPIQNIGAYGVEVGEFIHRVEAFAPATGEWHYLSATDCAFAYRDSLFKRESGRFIITAVEFALPRNFSPRLSYAGISAQLASAGVSNPTAQDVAAAVVAIRRSKLPDPTLIGNAGSFFKNPILPAAQASALQDANPSMPTFATGSDATRKVSAAWLIDACGWKGRRNADAGVSESHALVLVNHGAASGLELYELAREIAGSVRKRFGVALEPEPRLIGAIW
ncbi:UDP-N-acetylmuramate dehydrogenase [Lysobacter ciconiae]|uniref:UDP-N-acetylenolpyruvoylglucosamine reductase n=1 Tax=Novilysobacter ciconiae TaxID=2781022 RepID=A0A7S6UHH4_9GAMM|nr:UDP-N-acetylmuramate dehydrogenase [Lysobacter ciconiae]QOW20398.1 UDP-N-acetylmuramate dehydrogenase [Lysobacter ciconiae]